MKITAKTTKEQLKDFLGLNVKAVKKADKGLFDRIAYADKMLKTDETKVSRKDLSDLAKEVIKLLGSKVAEPVLAEEKPVENSVKKLSKGVSKKQEIAQDVDSESVEAEKTAKKSLGKKKEPKEGVTVLETDAETTSPKAVQLAKAFPQTLDINDTKYELAQDIKTMEDLYNALGRDEEIVFAYYWTKRHLKQFPYYNFLLGQPKSFDYDLDLATVIYVSDEFKISYQISMYTEALYSAMPADFEEIDGVRVAGGIEFQIYRVTK